MSPPLPGRELDDGLQPAAAVRTHVEDRGNGAGPSITVWAAVRRHWLLASIPVVLLVGLAVVAASLRSPQYTAESRMAAGRLDASAPEALAGFTAASASLAETYSRSIRGDAIVDAVARASGKPVNEVRSALSAETIPDSPLFTVRAIADDPDAAAKLSVLAAKALVRQRRQESSSAPNADRLLSEYREASAELASAKIAAQVAANDYERHQTTDNTTRLVAAQAEVATAELKLDSARVAYVNGHQGEGSVALVQLIARPRTATTDRLQVLQLWLFVAAVTGVAVGLALALARARQEAVRSAFADA
jgi:capsular polysaccharide biosynthesis protein